MNTILGFIRCTLPTNDEIYININSISVVFEEERVDKSKITAIFRNGSDTPIIVKESVSQVLSMMDKSK